MEQHSPKKGFSFMEKESQIINSDFALWVCCPEVITTSHQEKILHILFRINISFSVAFGFVSFCCFLIIGCIGDVSLPQMMKSQSFVACSFILHLSHVQWSSENGTWHLVPWFWQQGSLRGSCCARAGHNTSTVSACGRPGIRIYLVFWTNYPQIISSGQSFLLE